MSQLNRSEQALFDLYYQRALRASQNNNRASLLQANQNLTQALKLDPDNQKIKYQMKIITAQLAYFQK